MDSREIAKRLAEESIVLLKNEDKLLPLKKGQRVAVFGRTQEDTVFSGNGSGANHQDGGLSILTAIEKAGLIPEPCVADYYRAQVAAGVGCQEEFDWSLAGSCVNSGLMYEIFGQYRAPSEEYELTLEQLLKARDFSDTAILVLGRNSGGEECDRHLYDDYYLTQTEKKLIEDVAAHFENVILILNINGVIDLSFATGFSQIKSILFIGIPGEQGTIALADILIGGINPSGKLSFTFAKAYEDYPTSKDFTWDKNNPDAILEYSSYGLSASENGSVGFDISPITVYREDIYLGYRYFDAFGIEPLYPFGHGLSYTKFSYDLTEVSYDEKGVTLTVAVKNIGECSGKEVLQAYVDNECKKLAGFCKTKELKPTETEQIKIEISWRELAIFNEKTASWEIDCGKALLMLGTSSADINEIGIINVPNKIIISKACNRLGIKKCNEGKIEFLKPCKREASELDAKFEITLTTVALEQKSRAYKDFENIDELSNEELACLCVGYGPGIPFSAFLEEKLPNTLLNSQGEEIAVNDHPTGFNGYISPAMPNRNIHSVFYKDGPAGIGETAWPTQMLISCSFNRDLWFDFGVCISLECEKQQVDFWLAPAVNLHRNPLGGRCFEYFSEDPFLTGSAAVCVANGVQNSGKVFVCPKHFCANEQETFRRGNAKRNVDAVDSIMTQRALRELYLRPFEMLVKEADIHSIMTSFNKINGTFAGGSADLCTHILRDEWQFEGAVVTDWGDMDTVVDGANAIRAGNDIIMPGGPPVIKQILKGLEDKRVTRAELIKAVKNLLTMISYTRRNKR